MGGKIFFGVLSLVAIAAIAALLYRPATVIGVSDKSLAYSLRGAADSAETGNCQGRDDRFVCTAVAGGSSGTSGDDPRTEYAVTTDDFGCWEAERRGGAGNLPDALDGCITIVDLVRVDD